MRARLGEAVPLFEQAEAGVVRVAFKGSNESVTFVAPTQNGPAGAGLYRFVLEVGPAATNGASRALFVKLAPYQPKQGEKSADYPSKTTSWPRT